MTSTASMISAVSACSHALKRLFSVMSTAASMAPGLAIDGTANGKTAVSPALSASLISSSGLLSPKIMLSAKRKRMMPPAISNAARGMSMALRITSPATRKKSRMSVAMAVACRAICRLVRASYPLVTAMKTGTEPMGSITAKKKMKVAMMSCMGGARRVVGWWWMLETYVRSTQTQKARSPVTHQLPPAAQNRDPSASADSTRNRANCRKTWPAATLCLASRHACR